MSDILKEIEKIAQELKQTGSENEVEQLTKLAAEATDGIVKTAEEAQIFHLGRIFGQGMAFGWMEKIAQAMEEAAAAEDIAAAASGPVSADPTVPEVVEQQIPAEDIDDSEFVEQVAQLKAIVRSMTPAEVLAWYNSLPAEARAFVDNDPELSTIVNEAKKLLAAQHNVAGGSPEPTQGPETQNMPEAAQ